MGSPLLSQDLPSSASGCSLRSRQARGPALPSLPLFGRCPACWPQWRTHLVLMLELRPSGLISPAGSACLQLMIYGCPLTLFKRLSSWEHLLCGRASCVCSDTWSDSSWDRLGSQSDRRLNFCCPGKASLPLSSSESKQTFSLPHPWPQTSAESQASARSSCLQYLPSYSGSDGREEIVSLDQ